MGNLVTTAITLTGPDPDLERLLSGLTPAAPGALLTEARSAPLTPSWVSFAPWRAIPEPEPIAATRGDPITDIGLAVLSRDGVDHLRLKQGRNPAYAELPPELTDTSEGLLKRFGLDGLDRGALHQAATARWPGCLEAARRAIAAFEATGEFGWHDWRLKNWGVRAFGEELRVSAQPDGALTLRFDAVNDCPVPLLRTLLSRAPEIQMNGAAIDEDGGFAVFLASDGTTLIVAESDEAEEMGRAYEIVYGRTPEPADDDPDP